jgi:uncharacterized Tic20 family protein
MEDACMRRRTRAWAFLTTFWMFLRLKLLRMRCNILGPLIFDVAIRVEKYALERIGFRLIELFLVNSLSRHD